MRANRELAWHENGPRNGGLGRPRLRRDRRRRARLRRPSCSAARVRAGPWPCRAISSV